MFNKLVTKKELDHEFHFLDNRIDWWRDVYLAHSRSPVHDLPSLILDHLGLKAVYHDAGYTLEKKMKGYDKWLDPPDDDDHDDGCYCSKHHIWYAVDDDYCAKCEAEIDDSLWNELDDDAFEDEWRIR